MPFYNPNWWIFLVLHCQHPLHPSADGQKRRVWPQLPHLPVSSLFTYTTLRLRDLETEKRKLDDKVHASRSKQTGRPSESRHGLHTSLPRSGSSKRPQQGVSPASLPLKPAPSNVLAKLASLNNQSNGISPMDNITRSLAFAEKAVAHPNLDADTSIRPDEIDAPKRDDRLALIEDLEVGPADHKPPFDDPHFQQLEPNSGIRLSCVSE